jgi:hypothetical protein
MKCIFCKVSGFDVKMCYPPLLKCVNVLFFVEIMAWIATNWKKTAFSDVFLNYLG